MSDCISLGTCGEFTPAEAREDALEQEFHSLVARWQADTLMSSHSVGMEAHPAYLRIIGLGRPVLPLIYREMKRMPDHWFAALEAITGVNPVTPEAAGRLKRMTEAWLQYLQDNGLAQEAPAAAWERVRAALALVGEGRLMVVVGGEE